MEAIFAPIQDVPSVSALDLVDTVGSESAIDPGRVEGDFARGLRLWPFVCRPGDFATGLRTASVTDQHCDFATGLRTRRPTESNRGDFATGMRRGSDPADRRSAPAANGVSPATR